MNPIICHKTKSIYVMIPKCACSTIRHLLLKNQKGDPNLAYDRRRLQRMERVSLDELDKYQNYFAFTFIRNPVERFISAFEDKALNLHDNEEDQAYPPFYGKTLDEMLSYTMSGRPIEKLDPHFRPQVWFIDRFVRKRPINFIGTVEMFESDIGLLKATLDIDYDHDHLRRIERKTILSREQRDLLCVRYIQDYKLWSGYTFLWKTISTEK